MVQDDYVRGSRDCVENGQVFQRFQLAVHRNQSIVGIRPLGARQEPPRPRKASSGNHGGPGEGQGQG